MAAARASRAKESPVGSAGLGFCWFHLAEARARLCVCACEWRHSLEWPRTNTVWLVCALVCAPVSVYSHVGIVQHAHLGREPEVSVNMHVYLCFWAKVRMCVSASV